MKGLIALFIFSCISGAFIFGTKVGAVQQAAREPPRVRYIHEHRAKCINVAPTKAKKVPL